MNVHLHVRLQTPFILQVVSLLMSDRLVSVMMGLREERGLSLSGSDRHPLGNHHNNNLLQISFCLLCMRWQPAYVAAFWVRMWRDVRRHVGKLTMMCSRPHTERVCKQSKPNINGRLDKCQESAGIMSHFQMISVTVIVTSHQLLNDSVVMLRMWLCRWALNCGEPCFSFSFFSPFTHLNLFKCGCLTPTMGWCKIKVIQMVAWLVKLYVCVSAGGVKEDRSSYLGHYPAPPYVPLLLSGMDSAGAA